MAIRQNMSAKVSLLALAVVLVGSLFVEPVHGAEKLRVSNCYIGGAILPLWLAQDAGFYAR
jgi:hypothetical protein